MCDCGSRVFFNQLGSPWPRHNCQAFVGNVADFKPHIARGKAYLTPFISVETVLTREGASGSRADAEPFALEESLTERMRRNERRRLLDNPIVRIDPMPLKKAVRDGIVREVQKEADPYRDLQIRPTAMAAKFLGPLGRDRHAKLTIHAGSLSDDQIQSYTFFVRREEAARVHKEDIVQVSLEAYGPPGGRQLWFCTKLSPLN